MPVPTLDARIDWAGDGYGASSPDVITTDVLSARITSGSSEFASGDAPARLTLRVKNEDGKYNDLNGSSPLAGLLRPYRPIHINATWSAVTYGLFDGYVENIVPINDPGDPVAEITAVDPLGRWRTTDVSVAIASRSYADFRAAILTALGSNLTNVLAGGAELPMLPRTAAFAESAGELLSALNVATLSRHFVHPLASFTAPRAEYITRDRNYKLEGAVDATHVRGTDYERTEEWQGLAGTIVNEQTVVPTSYVYAEDPEEVWRHPWPVFAPRTIYASWSNPIESPTLVTGTQSGTISAAVTWYERAAKIVLSGLDTGSYASLAIRGRVGSSGMEQPVVGFDSASQTIFDKVAGPVVSSPWVPSAAIGQGVADHMVYRFAAPRRRPRLLYENRFPAMFDRRLFDVLAITDSSLGLSNWRCEIVGFDLTIDTAGERWVLHRTVQEAPSQSSVNYFDIGTDTVGGAAILPR